MPTIRRALLLATFSLTLGACATLPEPVNVVDTAARTAELSTFTRLVQQAGLADTLRAGGPYTVFAPSDEAFKALPAKTLADLAGDKEQLKSVLGFHVVASRLPAAEVKNGNQKTLQGANLALSKAGTFVTVEDALVTRADVTATNGVVHVVDKVLMPPKR